VSGLRTLRIRHFISARTRVAIFSVVCLLSCKLGASDASTEPPSVAVGPEYATTHVYIAPSDFDALVNSLIATFGGKTSKRIVANVLPVPSSTQQQAVFTPVGVLSIFAYQTPVPFPFGDERTGSGYRHGRCHPGCGCRRGGGDYCPIQGPDWDGCHYPMAGRGENAALLAL
jgi:hypothetical protein